MPPHLHPRSSATTTLFTSTLAASFIIVGIPHVFPCPAPRKGYLDEDGKLVRRRRRQEIRESDAVEKTEGSVRQIENPDRPANLTRELRSLLGRSAESDGRSDAPLVETMGVRGSRGLKGEEEEEDARAMFRDMKEEADALEREKRECPVPKPRGKIGELLGFGRDGRRLRDEDAR